MNYCVVPSASGSRERKCSELIFYIPAILYFWNCGKYKINHIIKHVKYNLNFLLSGTLSLHICSANLRNVDVAGTASNAHCPFCRFFFLFLSFLFFVERIEIRCSYTLAIVNRRENRRIYVIIAKSGQWGKKLACSHGLANKELWSWKM